MGSALLANVVLCLPLLGVVVIALALNNLYSKAPGQVLKSSFTELHDIVYGLGIVGCAVLGIDHLFGSFQRQATLEPVTIVVALLSQSPPFRLGAPSVVRCCVPSRPSSAECS